MNIKKTEKNSLVGIRLYSHKKKKLTKKGRKREGEKEEEGKRTMHFKGLHVPNFQT